METQAQTLPGTLDLLILKAVSLQPLHGYGVLLRIEQISRDALRIPQGSLYPALYRLEHQGHGRPREVGRARGRGRAPSARRVRLGRVGERGDARLAWAAVDRRAAPGSPLRAPPDGARTGAHSCRHRFSWVR